MTSVQLEKYEGMDYDTFRTIYWQDLGYSVSSKNGDSNRFVEKLMSIDGVATSIFLVLLALLGFANEVLAQEDPDTLRISTCESPQTHRLEYHPNGGGFLIQTDQNISLSQHYLSASDTLVIDETSYGFGDTVLAVNTNDIQIGSFPRQIPSSGPSNLPIIEMVGRVNFPGEPVTITMELRAGSSCTDRNPPTATLTPSETPTPTVTATDTLIPTAPPTETDTATPTLMTTYTPRPDATNTIIPTPTGTPTVAETATSTPTPNLTSTPDQNNEHILLLPLVNR